MKARGTWYLVTLDGRTVYLDAHERPTFKYNSNTPFEFIEGQWPDWDKEFLAKKVGSELGTECVWLQGPNRFEEE